MATKESYIKHREARLLHMREYYQKNKEIIKERTKKWYDKNKNDPEFIKKSRARSRIYYEKNWEYDQKYNRDRREKQRKELLQEVGNGQCAKCGFNDWRALHVDHINGGGRKEYLENKALKSALGYLKHIRLNREKYQILCANCNFIKRHENQEKRKGYYENKS